MSLKSIFLNCNEILMKLHSFYLLSIIFIIINYGVIGIFCKKNIELAVYKFFPNFA